MLREIDRPRPVPWPGSLVVKNGSKICARSRGATPGPLSATRSSTASPSAARVDAHAAAPAHRVGGVEEQVHQHLHQPVVRRRQPAAARPAIARSTSTPAKRGCGRNSDSATSTASASAHRLDAALHRPRVVEQVGDDAADAIGLLANALERLATRAVGRLVVQQEIDVAEHGGERIADLVRHAGGEPADGDQLLLRHHLLALAAQRRGHAIEVVDEVRHLVARRRRRQRRQVDLAVGDAARGRRQRFDRLDDAADEERAEQAAPARRRTA